MLFAQFQPQNQAQQVGFWVGVAFAAIISGAIPLVTGLVLGLKLRSNRRAGARPIICVILAVVGGLLAAGTAFLVGCLGGLPIALLFTIPIVIVAATAPKKGRRRRRDYDDLEDDYDDRPRRRRYDDDEDDDYDRPRRRRDYDD